MKKFLTFILSLFYITTACTQEVYFNWVNQTARKTGLPFEESYFIGLDADKNVYIAGNFHFTLDLDPGPGVNNVTSQMDNIFVSKFDRSGNFIWGKHLGNNDKYSVCKSLSVDAAGNIYTTGYFTGKADFDPGPALYYLSANGNEVRDDNDVFISCLDTDGNFKWAKRFGSNDIDIGTSIQADNFGNVYTTGYFSNIVDLDPGPGVTNKGAIDVVNTFVTKLDSKGNFKYAKVFEGNHFSSGEFIRTDPSGNVYITGYFDGNVDFDPGNAVSNFTTEFFTRKNYLTKLDSVGNFVWAIRDITGLDFAVDPMQSVYTYDELLTKYDVNGNLVWVKRMGGAPNSTFPHAGIRTDNTGNIYITGKFRYTQDFDPGSAEYKLTVSGGGFAADAFVCKLDQDANFIWAKSFGAASDDYVTSIAIDNTGDVYTTGVFIGEVDFDPGPEVFKITSPPGGGIFLHKMSPCINKPPTLLDVVSCSRYTLNNVTYDSSGVYTQTLTDNRGCDSIIKLNLTINTLTSFVQVDTCSDYKWNGKLLTENGIYNDTLLTSAGCDSIVQLNLNITRTAATTNVVICSGESFAGHTVAGTYTDTLKTSAGCDSLNTINLTVLDKPVPDLGADAELCKGDSLILNAGNYQTYLWQDGSTGPYLNVKKGGVYSVTVTNSCGSGKDEIRVAESTCKMYFPNAFTPNSDGRNDRFIILHPPVLTDFQLAVYNRFGQKVFETNDYKKPWTGLFKGQPAFSGTYVWYCQFKEAGIAHNLKGTVLLLR